LTPKMQDEWRRLTQRDVGAGRERGEGTIIQIDNPNRWKCPLERGPSWDRVPEAKQGGKKDALDYLTWVEKN